MEFRSIRRERSCCWLFYRLASGPSCRKIIRLFGRTSLLRLSITFPLARLRVFAFLFLRGAILGFSRGRAWIILAVFGRAFRILWIRPREIMGIGFSSSGRLLASEGRIESKRLEESIFPKHLKESIHCSSFLLSDYWNLFHFHRDSLSYF